MASGTFEKYGAKFVRKLVAIMHTVRGRILTVLVCHFCNNFCRKIYTISTKIGLTTESKTRQKQIGVKKFNGKNIKMETTKIPLKSESYQILKM